MNNKEILKELYGLLRCYLFIKRSKEHLPSKLVFVQHLYVLLALIRVYMYISYAVFPGKLAKIWRFAIEVKGDNLALDLHRYKHFYLCNFYCIHNSSMFNPFLAATTYLPVARPTSLTNFCCTEFCDDRCMRMISRVADRSLCCSVSMHCARLMCDFRTLSATFGCTVPSLTLFRKMPSS